LDERWSLLAWRTPPEDDEAALVPFHLPVRGDGDFGRDERVAEARVEDRRRAGVVRGRFAPEIGVGRRAEREVIHAFGEGGVWRGVEGREGLAGWRHSFFFLGGGRDFWGCGLEFCEAVCLRLGFVELRCSLLGGSS